MLTDSRIDRSKEIWRGAKIIMIKKNNIRIHFLGWDKRWDTNIDVLRGSTLSIYPSIHLTVCLPVYLFIFFIHLPIYTNR